MISLGLCGPTHDERSWKFDLDPGEVDPVLGIKRLREAFLARFPDYDKGITVPAIVDIPSGQVVTNDFPSITHDLFHEWREFHRPDAPDLWPADLRDEMDAGHGARLHRGQQRCVPLRLRRLPGGVRRGYARLWDAMDWLEQRLSTRRYLMGDAHHRGRHPAVHHAGPVRRRLPRPLQVQPAEAHRDAGAAGATPATCSRRPVSATTPTSTRSSATTTWSRTTSTRPRSCRPARIHRCGWSRTTGTASRTDRGRRRRTSAGAGRCRST